MPTDRTLATLGPDRCLALLRSKPVGRLVFTQHALPEVLPVNYRVDDGIVLRLASGSPAARACRGGVVAFQIDDVHALDRTGWSVTVVGHAAQIDDPAERRRLAALPLQSWLGESRDVFIRIRLDRVTGREILPATPRFPAACQR